MVMNGQQQQPQQQQQQQPQPQLHSLHLLPARSMPSTSAVHRSTACC
jgi:hypothetical protein